MSDTTKVYIPNSENFNKFYIVSIEDLEILLRKLMDENMIADVSHHDKKVVVFTTHFVRNYPHLYLAVIDFLY